MKDQDQYLSVLKFPAFVSLSLLIISALYICLVYFILQDQVTEPHLVRGLLIALLVVIVFMIFTWVSTLMSTHIRIKPRWMSQLN
ncbi:MAG TPA: hypothetical protein PLL58_03460, partial [Candidatus Syntrophosphaera sp.]|nr:hypothetical protein [Candidatus Syntrophosphaera sp.]